MSSRPEVPENYQPTDKDDYMNPVMKEYFRGKLEAWKNDLIHESQETLHHLHDDGGIQEPDIADRATTETDYGLELRTRDRYRKLINKIEAAQRRIDEDTYGYCEESGEPIGLARLEARPIATMSVEAQERHERKEKLQRDD